ncbi:MAG: signal transduction histidine kinase/ActR/RegA family two-component response regulator [Brevundimonas sp.]|jgi:signal transduction histidine kinase/ActR/RegA family two-component response regulator|uniref:hybrid sensor histidine kinase/response regulator n=1 Tax=Brevundimonas sp. TaxID=1871086 RepID=UPI0039E27271
MHGRWRLFRHEGGLASGPPAWAYVVLFSACLLLGIWSARTFGAVVIWPANGVMLAALLQLHRRKAVSVLAACLTINLLANIVRGDPMPFLWLNAVLNLGQVCLAGLIARRVGGAALDLRQPRRLANFALLAVTPAVLLSALLIVTVAASLRPYSLTLYLFTVARYSAMEILGMLMVTPVLLLIAKSHRFRDSAPASPAETLGLMVLLMGVTAGVFFQPLAGILFLVFPPLLLIAFRASPVWVARAVILVAVIGGFSTATGQGPIALTRMVDIPGLEAVPLVIHRLNIFYLFLLAVVVTALPVSTVMSARRRLVARLQARTTAAQVARRRAEEADAVKTRFLALMSHEMRTPLNSVTGYAEVLARRPAMEAEARVQLDQIQRSGECLLMLVEDVLEVSRGDESLDLQPLVLSTLLTAAVETGRPAAADKGVELTLEIRPTASGSVTGDRRRLRQTLNHLIGNAVKFTDRGTVRVVADRIDGDVVITVADTGCGLDTARADALFEVFVQGDDSISRCHGGAGIGLALVKRHATIMGGAISVASRPGEGAIFTLRLPLPAADTEAGEAIDPTEGPAATGETEARAPRVLVVDDHPSNREVARLMLTAAGCEVVEAADGDEAVDMARAGLFDLILMDVRMPRVDGLAATRMIRNLPGAVAHTPILAVTADAMPADAARCLAAGMNAHLAKPISHQALYAAMDRLLTASSPDATAAA